MGREVVRAELDIPEDGGMGIAEGRWQRNESKQNKWKLRANPGSFPWKTEERSRRRWGFVSVQREEAVGCALFYNRKASHTAAKMLGATVGVGVKYPEEGWLYLNSVWLSLPRCPCTPQTERQVPFTWLVPASHTVSLHNSYLVRAEWVKSWVNAFCWLHTAVSKTPETQREMTNLSSGTQCESWLLFPHICDPKMAPDQRLILLRLAKPVSLIRVSTTYPPT